jgi:hypothetical protein|tara:strand:- start:2374 stop:3027 length:654 start_codon:yes stop_codon:yes gene_type:complete
MKVKIKDQGIKKEYRLIDSWKDVTLEKWLLLNGIDTSKKGQEALQTISILSTIPQDLIKKLDMKSIAGILSIISELQNKADTTLKNIITIDKIDYGFHPDLDSITLGEYADLESFISEGVESNLPEIMAILYRPIVDRKKKNYTIEAYDGDIKMRALEMLTMTAEQVQSALIFFYHLVNELVKIMPLYLIEETKETIKQLQPNPLPISGDGLESSID